MNHATYGGFSRGIHERHFGRRAPVEVSIEVTRRCPLECLHCYNNLPMNDAGARQQELSLEEHRQLLDELVAAGCLWILYTGGEIFARPDFLDIYTEAKKRGFLVTLFTNGTLITPRVADYLAEWRPFAIEITLYGATRETYEALTQIPGSYDRCMRASGCSERGLPLKLKTVPTTINKHEVYEMQRLAVEEFGVEFKLIRWSTRASTARRARWRCGYRRRMPSRWSFLIRGASRSTGAWRNWTELPRAERSRDRATCIRAVEATEVVRSIRADA